MNNDNMTGAKPIFSLTPTSLQEAMEYAKIIASSVMVPRAYHGRPGDILVAVQMGAELGLKPIQALQNIAVINGRPSIYGDALLALVQSHSSFEEIQETFDEVGTRAICVVKRKNQSEYRVSFSAEDAKKAGLWGKQGPWSQYPKRMLQMRARSFALRDRFADVLSGLIIAEEAQDYAVMKEGTAPQNDQQNTHAHTKQNKIAILKDKVSSIAREAQVEEKEESDRTDRAARVARADETDQTEEIVDSGLKSHERLEDEDMIISYNIPTSEGIKWYKKAKAHEA